MKTRLPLRGRFYVEHRDENGKLKGIYRLPNGIVDVGLNHILETEFHAGTAVATWYIGLVDNAGYSAFANADTMASHAGWAESVAYTEATRPQWAMDAAAARQITNSTSTDFSINGTATLKGIFVTSGNAKSGTAGTLWATAAFASTVSVLSGDTLKVTYTVSG